MQLKDYKQSYYDHSGLSSSVTRQAAFAGIALVWIFNSSSDAAIALPRQLLVPTFFFVLSLSFDLLQYIVASAIWGLFHRIKEKQGIQPEDNVRAPACLNWPTLTFFWGKHVSIIIGYLGLITYFLGVVDFGGK